MSAKSNSVKNTTNQTNKKKHIIIDSDIDIDDWMAILYLLNHPDIVVEGITVVGTGAAHIKPGVQNALDLVQLAGYPDLPIAIGLSKPMAYDHQFPLSIRLPVDNLFGIKIPKNSTPALPDALAFLESQLTSSQNKTTILAIGPMTNLGTLLQGNPELVNCIERIVIMGGTIDAPGNVNIADPSIKNYVAEWNIYCDPVAADIVLKSGVPITLVPLDGTQHAPITPAFYTRLLQHHLTPSADFVYQALTADYDFIASGGFDFWDPLAAALLSQEDLGIYSDVSLSVVTDDSDRSGQLLIDDNGAQVKACFDVNEAAFEDLFLSTLNGELTPKDQVTFLLDGESVTLTNVSPQDRLIDYLHQPHVNKAGTKLVCGQGGCGACTVMLTCYSKQQHKVVNKAINACLRPLVGLDGAMVTTTQGIGNVKDGVDEVQYKLAANNGSQCGYCSPGFTMNMFTLRQNNDSLSQKQIEDNFDGNICRCTGYRPILDAFKQFADDYHPPCPEPEIKIDPNFKPCQIKPFERILPPSDFIEYMMNPQPLLISQNGYTYERPVTLEALLKSKENNGPIGENFRLLSGNTSVGIYETQAIYAEQALNPNYLIDVSAIPELQEIEVTDQGIIFGAATTLSQMLVTLSETIDNIPTYQSKGLVALKSHTEIVANLQIRNEATLAGNVFIATNLGFLSDMVLMLATLGATITIATKTGIESYPILNTPKEADLPQSAVYKSFFIPFTERNSHVHSFKIRRRNEDCHALVNAGFLVRFNDEKRVTDCTIVYNGIHADYELESTKYGLQFHPITVEKTRNILIGKAWNKETIQAAMIVLAGEVAEYEPPSGKAGPYEIGQIPFAYRASLAETLFYKFAVAVADKLEPQKVNPKIKSAGRQIIRPLSKGQQFYNSYPEEAPVSEPFIKLSAFLQTTGEAKYTHDMTRPPDTLEAAFVYSLVAFGTFYYQLPVTTSHGVKGQKVSAAQLIAFLKDWNGDFIAFINYDDIPVKEKNWVGLGGDDPIFVPSIDQHLPDGFSQNPNFYPDHVTCVGAPIGLIICKDLRSAKEIADYVRTECIHFDAKPGRSFDQAIKEKFYLPQYPANDPGLSHIPQITRPGSNESWLEYPEETPFIENGKEYPVVTGSHRTGYQNHFYLETMNTLAIPGENRSIVINTASQVIADNQYTAAGVLGIPAVNVQVKLTRLGGGFGGRQTRSRFNSTAAAVAAWVLNKPIRLALDRNTNFITCGERHSYQGDYAIAYDNDGTIKGFSIDFKSDGGNTYDVSFPIMDMSLQSNDNAYNIGSYKVSGNVCQTNKASNTAFRTFGLVQANNLTEQAIEQVAYELNKSPEFIREKNLYKNGMDKWTGFTITEQTLATLLRLKVNKEAIKGLRPIQGIHYPDETTFVTAVDAHDPTDTFTGAMNLDNMISLKQYSTTSYDFTPYMEGLKDCKLKVLWDELKKDSEFDVRQKRIKQFNSDNKWRKRGISMMPLKYGVSYSGPRGTLDQGGAYVVAYSNDGSVLVSHGGVEMGQGIQTKMAQIAAESLDVPIELIKMSDTDTNVISDASATAASTGSDLNGGAVALACKKLRDRLEKFCEDLEQYTVYFSKFDQSKMDESMIMQIETVTKNWREHWSEVWPIICSLAYVNRVGLAAEARYKAPNYSGVDINHSIGNTFFYYTYAVAVSEVEIDVLTGDLTIIRSDILFDIGKSLNPLIDIGQIEGGFVQGIGYVTTEEMTYQGLREAPRKGYPEGAITSTNTWEYKPPGTKSIPLDMRVRIYDNSGKCFETKGPKHDAAAVKSSKGIGEPPLVLANTVFFAIKQAIQSFYKEQKRDEWVHLDAPATVEKIQSACRVAMTDFEIFKSHKAK